MGIPTLDVWIRQPKITDCFGTHELVWAGTRPILRAPLCGCPARSQKSGDWQEIDVSCTGSCRQGAQVQTYAAVDWQGMAEILVVNVSIKDTRILACAYLNL